MSAARLILKLLDRISHALPLAWTGAPHIGGQSLDPLLHWMLALRARRHPPALDAMTPEDARAALCRDLIPLQTDYEVLRATEMIVPGADGPLAARRYAPFPGTACDAIIVYFHGGGFVLGDLDTHDDICRLLCRTVGAQVLSVAYRLAPEHPFPAAVNDAIAVTRWVTSNLAQFNACRIVVGGDSAGANLAAVTAQAMANEGISIAAELLLYPSTDYATPRLSRDLFSKGLFLSNEDRAWFYQHYLQGAEGDDPRVSPLLGNVSKELAQAIVVTAALDVLRDEGRAYADVLKEHGILIEYIEAVGLGHGFANLIGVHRHSEETIVRAATRLRTHLFQSNDRDNL